MTARHALGITAAVIVTPVLPIVLRMFVLAALAAAWLLTFDEVDRDPHARRRDQLDDAARDGRVIRLERETGR